MTMNFISNINLIHKYEEEIRHKSLNSIQEDNEMKDHLQIIHDSMDFIHMITTNYLAANDNELIIQKLAIDIFNSISSSLKLVLSGHYKSGYSLLRFILESATLIDYFNSEPNEIKAWFNAGEKERKNIYSNVKLRIYLDDRDGNTEKKREKQYKLYCEYASHPSSKGFLMISEENNVVPGPFYKSSYLGNYLVDLARESIYTGDCLNSYFIKSSTQYKMIVNKYQLKVNNWKQKFLIRNQV